MLFTSLFQLHLMKDCLAKSVACIASIVQQLLQTLLAVLIDIYFKAKRSLAALVMTIIFVLFSTLLRPFRSSLIRCPFLLKRSSSIMFNYQTNRTTIPTIGFDWVLLIFGSVSFSYTRAVAVNNPSGNLH